MFEYIKYVIILALVFISLIMRFVKLVELVVYLTSCNEVYFVVIPGCPLVGFKPDISQQFSTMAQPDKGVICSALFHSVNWFREVRQ